MVQVGADHLKSLCVSLACSFPKGCMLSKEISRNIFKSGMCIIFFDASTFLELAGVSWGGGTRNIAHE